MKRKIREEEWEGKIKRAFKTSVVIDLFPVPAINPPRFTPTLIFAGNAGIFLRQETSNFRYSARRTCCFSARERTTRGGEKDKEKDEKRKEKESFCPPCFLLAQEKNFRGEASQSLEKPARPSDFRRKKIDRFRLF